MTSSSNIGTAQEKAANGNRRLLVLALAGLLIGLLAGWLTIRFLTGDLTIGPYAYRGIVIQSPEVPTDFTLTAHDGNTVRLSDFRDEIALLYFGYTYCPDVCPTTLSTYASALDMLKPEEREQVQLLMVSVDPQRDTPQTLADYLGHFDTSFLGLTGSEEEIGAAAEPFGIFFQKGPGTIESGYLVDHTATVSVLDRAGRLRLLFPFDTPPEDIADDLRHMLREE